jgi:hypothetical protein
MSNIHSLSPATVGENQPAASGLSLAIFTRWLLEIQNQPSWRAKADKQMDYVDGNQLDSEVLRKQAAIGMPPAIEPLIGPAVDAVVGFEAKTRTDWRITADTDGGDEVAEALNYKLNQAERKSGADKACSDAFKPQYCIGLGWVEVSREGDPFKFPYRCTAVHRNEIFWDMLDREPGLPKARYLIRRRWTDAEQAALKFPAKADLIRTCSGRWTDRYEFSTDGGTSTNLGVAYEDERGWSIEEQEWRDADAGRVCLFEVWYRRWVSITVLRLPDGRVVEYDDKNAMHVIAVASGRVKPMKAVVAKMHLSYWMGPHKLHDGPTPYKHQEFPYVQFIGKLEDRTGVPLGAVKGMLYLQDNVNSATSKIRWGLSAVTTIRTKGAYAGTDEQFRQTIARVDADIVLDADHMQKPGAKFEVKRDFQLNEQQYKMLQDSRMGIERQSVPASFSGREGNARSGLQESTQVEQAMQSLAGLMDNFKFSRAKVGELLLSMIIEDLAGKQETIIVKGNQIRDDKPVHLNVPQVDPDTQVQYMDNDVERIMLKVAMSDVPSTPSFRSQQLAAMSEAFKSMPPQYQEVALPHLLALMDVPDRDKLLEDVKNAKQQLTPEVVQQRIDEAVKIALQQSDHALRGREIELRYNPDKIKAEVDALIAKNRDVNASAVEKTMRMFFASGQSAQMLAAVPQLAPLMDALAKASGYVPPTPEGVDPNVPVLDAPAPGITQDSVTNKKTGTGFMPGVGMEGAPGDTSPTTPANPAIPASPMTGQNQGIETARTSDNLQGA